MIVIYQYLWDMTIKKLIILQRRNAMICKQLTRSIMLCSLLLAFANASNIIVGSSYYNVKDAAYGAKGDDSTPDGDEIQLAIDACRAAGGGTVYFPEGKYIIEKTLYIGSGSGTNGTDKGDGVCLLGEGVNRTRLIVSPSIDAIVLRGGAPGNPSQHNMVSGMTILKDNIDYSGCVSGGSAISISLAVQATIENVWIWNWGTARFSNGISIGNDCSGTNLRDISISGADYGVYCTCWDTKIQNIVCDDELNDERVLYGVYLSGPADATTISESKFMGCDYGIYVSGGAGNRIMNNTIGTCRVTGIYVTTTSSVFNMGLIISGNEMEGNGATHTRISGSYETTKSNFQHNEIWIARSAPSIARGITIIGNYFNLTGMKDSTEDTLRSPYDISDPVQLSECTFNRNIYQDYEGGTFSSEGFSVGAIPEATANSASLPIQAGCQIKFKTQASDASGSTGIVANPNGWSRIDPNGSRFIIPITTTDFNAARNVFDMERTDTWDPLIQFNANGSAFFNGSVGVGTNTPNAKLEVAGNLNLSSTTHADLELNSTTRPTIYPHGSNTPTNLDFQVCSKGTGTMQINNDVAGNVTLANGGGNVGVGTNTPNAKLEVAGNLNLSSTTHADLELNSTTRPTIYPHGSNTPTNLDLQVCSKGTGTMQVNNDVAGNVTLANGGGKVGIGIPIPTEKLEVNGNIKSGNGTWNGGHLIMGTYHFWIDTNGKLRTKNGAPTSATDGAIVGSQS
jgi:parallel beta-helix repeat protein